MDRIVSAIPSPLEGVAAGIDPDRKVAAIIFGVDRADALRQLDQRLELEQRMADQPVRKDARMLRVEAGERILRFAGEESLTHRPLPSCRCFDCAGPGPRRIRARPARQILNVARFSTPARGTVTRTSFRRSAHRLLIIGWSSAAQLSIQPMPPRSRVFRFSIWMRTPGEKRRIFLVDRDLEREAAGRGQEVDQHRQRSSIEIEPQEIEPSSAERTRHGPRGKRRQWRDRS
jgi:hypothetical protein